jgi:hypothetical protein
MNENAVSSTAMPECPWWCTEAHGEGWDVGGGQLTRHCRRSVLGPDDVDGQPIGIELTRFACLVDGQVLIEPPTIERAASGPMSLGAALTVAETLTRLAELAGEPGTAAA